MTDDLFCIIASYSLLLFYISCIIKFINYYTVNMNIIVTCNYPSDNPLILCHILQVWLQPSKISYSSRSQYPTCSHERSAVCLS
jgi:hypothetical protein